MGSVKRIEREKGIVYIATWDEPRGADGRRSQRRKTFPTRKAADQHVARMEVAYGDADYVTPSDVPLREFIEQWLDHKRARKVRGSTLRTYRSAIDNHILPALGDLPVGKIPPARIQQCLNAILRAGHPTSARACYIILHNALGLAVRWRLRSFNPMDAVSAPPRPRADEKAVWSAAQVREFLDKTRDHPLYALWRLALSTGMRPGELLGLRWHDLDLANLRVTVRRTVARDEDGAWTHDDPKSAASHRTISITQPTIDALIVYRERQARRREVAGTLWHEEDVVFDRGDGKPFDTANHAARFRRLCRRLNMPPLPMTPHSLRHTHATLLLESNVHPKIVAARLGHSSVTITLDTYSHASPEMDRVAADAVESALTESSQNDAPVTHRDTRSRKRSTKVVIARENGKQ